MAPDFELDFLRLAVSLDAGGYKDEKNFAPSAFSLYAFFGVEDDMGKKGSRVQMVVEQLLLTGRILPPADLDELLDVVDCLGHDGRMYAYGPHGFGYLGMWSLSLFARAGFWSFTWFTLACGMPKRIASGGKIPLWRKGRALG